MKTILSLLLVVLLSTSGCMTMATVNAARSETHKDKKGELIVDKKAQPGYYALIPLTVAGDIATSPIQLFAFAMLFVSGIKC